MRARAAGAVVVVAVGASSARGVGSPISNLGRFFICFYIENRLFIEDRLLLLFLDA